MSVKGMDCLLEMSNEDWIIVLREKFSDESIAQIMNCHHINEVRNKRRELMP